MKNITKPNRNVKLRFLENKFKKKKMS